MSSCKLMQPQVGAQRPGILPAPELFAHSRLHCDEGDLPDTETTPRDIREVEAEAVARRGGLCCDSLGLPVAEFSRGYIQAFSKTGGPGPSDQRTSAQRAIGCATARRENCWSTALAPFGGEGDRRRRSGEGVSLAMIFLSGEDRAGRRSVKVLNTIQAARTQNPSSPARLPGAHGAGSGG